MYTETESEGGFGAVTYTPYSGTALTVTAYVGNESLTGTGTISATGQLSLALTKPGAATLSALTLEMLGYAGIFDDYNNLAISPSTGVNVASAGFHIGSPPNDNTLSKTISSVKGTLASGSSTYESLMYVYVDKDVTISGTGKMIDEDPDSSEGITYNYTKRTNTFSLALKEGWNTILIKDQASIVTVGTEATVVYNETLSSSNPSNLKWVLRD